VMAYVHQASLLVRCLSAVLRQCSKDLQRLHTVPLATASAAPLVVAAVFEGLNATTA
jgi:hypothetical protein